MAGLSLKHVYKVYTGRQKSKKRPVKALINKIRKKEEQKPAVEKRSGNFVAVKDFNMEIEDGEFIVFVGPSGCGKSTTIRMIAGLEDISAGELYIDGVLMNDIAPKERDIAMVFQSYALYPHMTAQQNIEFALKMRKIHVARVDENGNPVLAIDEKKVKRLKRELANVIADLEAVERDKQTVPALKEKKASLERELAAFADKQDAKAADKNKIKKQLEAVVDELRAIKIEIENIPSLNERKASFERDIEYYSKTPVPVYKLKRMPKEAIKEKVQWAAKILDIEELLDNKPAEMSGGQRQRIALGRAMVRGPKVFLLDEPLSNLDAKLRASMRYEIVKLHQELKTTFIYVTHDQVEAMTMGTRIVVMKLGIVQQIDTPTNLFDFPDNKFVAGFIGTPQMNFFDVTIKKNKNKLETTFANGQTVAFDLAKLRGIEPEYLDGESHEVTLGMRGEHLSVETEKTDKSVETSLVVKEVLGSVTQMFVKLTDDSPNTIISVSGRNDFESGDKVCVSFNERNVHLFDKISEKSIMNREYGNAVEPEAVAEPQKAEEPEIAEEPKKAKPAAKAKSTAAKAKPTAGAKKTTR
ncbi:MAG: ATP-binding cassette domain-containing protein [Clostridiales bacterium]|nr:ATP-binding cassette domain-containing protein [Clostridiales bacterium]